MLTVTKAVLDDIVQKIVGAVAPHKIVLFGSYGRGDATAESDLDLLIVQDPPFIPDGSRIKEMGVLWRMLADLKIPKDILIYTPEEVTRWSGSLNHIIPTALREGIVLYER